MPEPTQEHIEELARDLISSGDETSLQIAAVRDGELVVDIAVGSAGVDDPAEIDSASLFPVFSVSKAVTALVAYRALERGAIALDTHVADVWPEFAGGGKADIRFEELLAHTAGLAELPETTTFEEFLDWDLMTRRLALARPHHRGRARYHGLTYGWLVGETVRRALRSERGFGDIMRDELFDAPGSLASDFWFGIPDAVEPRIVAVVRDHEPTDDGHPLLGAIPVRFATTQQVYGRPDVRRACLPGVNGVGNAITLASLFARAASGELIDADVLDAGLDRRARRVDQLTGSPVVRAPGFYVADADEWSAPFSARARTFGHPGAGGSIAWGDRGNRAGYAICRGRLSGDGWRNPNVQRLVGALRSVVRPAPSR